jgi:hypothetical protein
MKPVDDELIAHIKESLSLHEEAYTPGAWENFSKKEKRRGGLIWLVRLSTAAAILLIGFIAFYLSTSPDIALQPVTSVTKADTSKTTGVKGGPSVAPTQINDAVLAANKTTSRHGLKKVANEAALIPASTQPQTNDPATILTQSNGEAIPKEVFEKPIDVVVAPKETQAAHVPVVETQKQSFQDFLNAETERNKTNPAKHSVANKIDSKWDLGLMVAPSIGNDKKINMGYGVSMEYAVSKKVSISSGVSYNQMGASKMINPVSNSMDAPAGAMALVQETKKLKSVDANLVGLDIPLELKYHFNDRFYTNVGLSAFAILNQKQNNNYVEGRVDNSAASMADRSAFNSFFKESTVSEPIPPDEARSDKYLGFYNLSIGYKQKVSGKNSLSIEPFMKLPIKEYSKENLRLIGTGVRLKFDF